MSVDGPSESEELLAEIDAMFAEEEREACRDEKEKRKRERDADGIESLAMESKRSRSRMETVGFGNLPDDAITRVLQYLSAEDLTQMALASRSLRDRATDNVLWRRLYGLRWKKLTLEERAAMRATEGNWMRLYRDRDKAEAQRTIEGAADALRGYYLDMHVAKRNVAPSSFSDGVSELALVNPTLAEVVDKYLKEKGLIDRGERHAGHVCSGNHCTFHEVGDAFVCEQTGRVHICDESCRERIVDPVSELLVCSISGRCFDRWVSQEEEERMSYDRFRAAEMEGMEELGTTTGRLGRAYQDGYACDTEHELFLQCGVKLR